MNSKQYQDFLHLAEDMKNGEIKRYECSCPVETNGSQELFFCKHLVDVQRQEMFYQSGKGYSKHWVERKLCSHKWMKDMGITEEPQERLQTEAGGIEDNFGEGGFI